MPNLLAQSKSLPSSNQGQRVILDQQAPVVAAKEPVRTIPQSTFYWIGAIALLVIAVFAAMSFLAGPKNTDKK